MLATPSQGSTAPYTADNKVFKQVYSFYSSDLVPILAPQGRRDIKLKGNENPGTCSRCVTPFLSRRKFPQSNNLIQSKVKFNGRGFSHTGILRCKFPYALPGILHDLKQECLIKGLPKRHGVYRLNILNKIE